MTTMILTQEQMESLLDLNVGQEHKGIKCIEKGPWEDGGKYSYQTIIYTYDNKFWSFTHDRSGSYFTDYNYDVYDKYNNGEATEVEQVEVVTKVWKEKQREKKESLNET